jgi:mannose-6-phosphate isomerase
MVKLIDAGERLSLQVHPDEKACSEIGGGAEPKTEM